MFYIFMRDFLPDHYTFMRDFLFDYYTFMRDILLDRYTFMRDFCLFLPFDSLLKLLWISRMRRYQNSLCCRSV